MEFEKPEKKLVKLEGRLLSQVKDKYIEELEKMVTDPQARFSQEELELVSRFIMGKEKIPKNHKWFYDTLIRVGQDFRLTPDEIDVLIDEFSE
ncbi:MAG: hypothetical protein HZB99_03815 [Candidatus Harrisonbacteria bacterium]|nr:hypothetical protein [Candidatus Harrisonbacteria bacterium]